MTDTPNLSALAMRTRAAEVCNELASDKRASAAKYRSGSNPNWERTHDAIIHETSALAILALPLEAYPAALVAEALKLPQIVALREALEPFAKYMIAEDGRMDRDAIGLPIPDKQGVGWIYLTYQDFRRAEAALTALEQP